MHDTLRATEAVETFVIEVIVEEGCGKAAAAARVLLLLLSKVFLVAVKFRRFL